MEYPRKKPLFLIAAVLLLVFMSALCVSAVGADSSSPADVDEESLGEFIIEKIEENYTWLIPVAAAAALAVASGILICVFYEKKTAAGPGEKN
ncbi:MAG: hypothetical protein ACOYIA_05425 [Eubacteriales bacterium]|jgi:hypothetical protein